MTKTPQLLTTTLSACLAVLISQSAAALQPLPAPEDGAFRIIEHTESPAKDTYLIEAGTKPNTCTFEIDFHKQSAKADSMVSITSAEITPKEITDCHTFLQSLGRALMFRGSMPMPSPKHLTQLSVAVAIFGTHDSGSPHEGFTNKPPGPWLTTKLFIEDPEAEVFFDLNTQDKIGGFSFKDEDYAPAVMTAFTNLLTP